MKTIIAKNGAKNALKLAGGISAGILLLSPGEAWPQCATPPPATLTVTGVCTESGEERISNAASTHVVSVTSNGVYTADNMTITSTDDQSRGVILSGPGSAVDLKQSTVTTHGEYGYGLHAEDGASLNIEDVDIVTHGYASDALLVQGADTKVELEGVNALTTGGAARGIRAMNGAVVEGAHSTFRTELDHDDVVASDAIRVESNARVSLRDSEISTHGGISSGIDTSGQGEFYGNRLNISTSGPDAWGGVVSNPGSRMTLNESTIMTTGSGPSRGVVASDSGELTLDQVAIATSGTGAHGVEAISGGTVTAQNLTIETTGSEASGTFVRNDGTTVVIDGADIRTSGDLAHALHMEDGGTLEVSSVSASAAGAGASAIALTRPSSDDVGAITINGGSLSATDAPLIRVDAGHGAITINGLTELTPGLVDGRQVLANVTDLGADRAADIDLQFNGVAGIPGDLITTGSGNRMNAALTSSDWTGDLRVDGDNTVQLDLVGSQWSGLSIDATAITLDSASTWNVTGSSTAGTLSNAGVVQFSPGSSGFSTLTVRDYHGQGGTLGINTVLDADDSPSDRLIIDGGVATGTTGLLVTNAGGTGALTTGDGIRVVETLNGGSTVDDAFSLSARTTAGAYEYQLFRGGSSSSEDWFLRSYLVEEQEETEVVTPLYRPEVPLYSPAPAMARQMGLSFLGTLHERVGEQMNVRPQADQQSYFNGAWVRVIGEHGNSKWSGPARMRARDATIAGIQAGVDIFRAEHANGHRDHIGIYGGHVRHRAKIKGFALGVDGLKVGKLTLDGPAVGAYWTHYSPSGGYLDGVVQWSWFDVDAKSDYGTRIDTKGTGFTASLEAGYPFALGERWQIEPQAQLIYQNTSIRGTSDALSNVSWREDDAVTGRLGARLQFTSEHDGTLWQPYVKANVWHGFNGKDHTAFGTDTVDTRFGSTSLEFGPGVTARVSRTVSVYAHLDHHWPVSGRERQSSTGGAIGLRINW